jgi:hypothetical protein
MDDSLGHSGQDHNHAAPMISFDPFNETSSQYHIRLFDQSGQSMLEVLIVGSTFALMHCIRKSTIDSDVLLDLPGTSHPGVIIVTASAAQLLTALQLPCTVSL